ncbi:MAG: hypothetical protein ACO2ZM_07570 [Francisellaceae bacterium]
MDNNSIMKAVFYAVLICFSLAIIFIAYIFIDYIIPGLSHHAPLDLIVAIFLGIIFMLILRAITFRWVLNNKKDGDNTR